MADALGAPQCIDESGGFLASLGMGYDAGAWEPVRLRGIDHFSFPRSLLVSATIPGGNPFWDPFGSVKSLRAICWECIRALRSEG